MRITEKRYHQIHQQTSKRKSGDAEWHRRGFTIHREPCGCATMDREVIGLGATVMTEYCLAHSPKPEPQAIPLRITLDG